MKSLDSCEPSVGSLERVGKRKATSKKLVLFLSRFLVNLVGQYARNWCFWTLRKTIRRLFISFLPCSFSFIVNDFVSWRRNSGWLDAEHRYDPLFGGRVDRWKDIAGVGSARAGRTQQSSAARNCSYLVLLPWRKRKNIVSLVFPGCSSLQSRSRRLRSCSFAEKGGVLVKTFGKWQKKCWRQSNALLASAAVTQRNGRLLRCCYGSRQCLVWVHVPCSQVQQWISKTFWMLLSFTLFQWNFDFVTCNPAQIRYDQKENILMLDNITQNLTNGFANQKKPWRYFHSWRVSRVSVSNFAESDVRWICFGLSAFLIWSFCCAAALP